jgi:hypothetical protein
VFFKNLSSLNEVYIQDQENSANSITYNITGTPVIVDQAQITIPVTRSASFGTGITSFGNGHNILLSFFTNSIEVDSRLTTLETKTQLITANFQKTTLSGGSQMKLNTLDSFVVSLDVGLNTFPKFTISGTQVSSLIPMNMSFNKLRGIPTPEDDDGAASKEYVDTAYIILDGRATALEDKTQNMAAIVSGSTFNKNSSFVLRVADADFFVVRNDSGTSKLSVSNTSVQINSVPLFMQGQKIQLLAEPTVATDGATKNYVDSAIGGGVGLAPYFRQVNQVAVVTTNGLLETTMTTTPVFGSYGWTDTAVGQSRKWMIQGFQNRGTFGVVYTIRFKSGVSGTTLNAEWVLPSQGPSAVANLPFILEITTVRSFANSLSYYGKFESVGASTTGFFLFTSQNQTGGVVALNSPAIYNITIQSSLASGNLSFSYVDVMAMVK